MLKGLMMKCGVDEVSLTVVGARAKLTIYPLCDSKSAVSVMLDRADVVDLHDLLDRAIKELKGGA